jgi:hypothetical protein
MSEDLLFLQGVPQLQKDPYIFGRFNKHAIYLDYSLPVSNAA